MDLKTGAFHLKEGEQNSTVIKLPRAGSAVWFLSFFGGPSNATKNIIPISIIAQSLVKPQQRKKETL